MQNKKLGEWNFDEIFFGFVILRAEAFEKKFGQSDMSPSFWQINHEMLLICNFIIFQDSLGQN